jgi:hypothetical protein
MPYNLSENLFGIKEKYYKFTLHDKRKANMTYVAKCSAKNDYESCITFEAQMRFHPLQIPQSREIQGSVFSVCL